MWVQGQMSKKSSILKMNDEEQRGFFFKKQKLAVDAFFTFSLPHVFFFLSLFRFFSFFILFFFLL